MITRRPGRPTPRDQQFGELLRDLTSGADPAKMRQLLRGPISLASPLRIGDLLIHVVPNAGDATRIEVQFQNAITMNPPITIWTVA